MLFNLSHLDVESCHHNYLAMYSLEDRLVGKWFFALSYGKQGYVDLTMSGYNMSDVEPSVNATHSPTLVLRVCSKGCRIESESA